MESPVMPNTAESRQSAAAPPMSGPTSSPTISYAWSCENRWARWSGALRSVSAARSAGT